MTSITSQWRVFFNNLKLKLIVCLFCLECCVCFSLVHCENICYFKFIYSNCALSWFFLFAYSHCDVKAFQLCWLFLVWHEEVKNPILNRVDLNNRLWNLTICLTGCLRNFMYSNKVHVILNYRSKVTEICLLKHLNEESNRTDLIFSLSAFVHEKDVWTWRVVAWKMG